MPGITDVQTRRRTSQQLVRDPVFLAFCGAVLLVSAPVLPGPSRLVVLPALLLAPGYALLRLLGHAAGTASISVAVPVSLVLAISASLVLNVSGIRLDALSLGSLLGAVTALFLAGSYGRRRIAEPPRSPGHNRMAPSPAQPDQGAAVPDEPDHGVRVLDQPLPEPARRSHPESSRAAPAAAAIRFAAEQPNECWQSDYTRYSLADGAGAEILTWLDEHSRLALSVTACQAVTSADVVAGFRAAVAAHGAPASTLTGNGTVYTTRFSGGRGRNEFERELRRLGITQKSGEPNHAQNQAKVQRFQQALKKWLRAQPGQPETLAQLQAQLDTFAAFYNQQRAHRSLHGATPAAAYYAKPKATPGVHASDAHDSAWAAHVGKTGTVCLHHDGDVRHIGIGAQHAGSPVLLLARDSHIRIIHARTGETLHDQVLDNEAAPRRRGRR
jgi:transposase InsO family protein